MEYTVKEKLLSLIFPVLCVIYGLLELRIYGTLPGNAVPITAIAAGIITGALTLKLKIDTTGYLKIQTISTFITYLVWLLIGTQILIEELSDIYNVGILAVSVFISTVKMPNEAPARDRLIVFFSNPVFYSLLKMLLNLLLNYMDRVGAI